jgi:hypothetical protein
VTWIAPSNAAYEARKLGYRHSYEDAVQELRRVNPLAVKAVSEKRDRVLLDQYIEVARAIHERRESEVKDKPPSKAEQMASALAEVIRLKAENEALKTVLAQLTRAGRNT